MNYLSSILAKLILRKKTTPWTNNSKEADFADAGEPVSDLDEANLITSVVKDEPSDGRLALPSGLHIPMFDLDMPCVLIESKTPGHFHLIIDKPIAFHDYMNILYTMVTAGIIEQGYYDSTGIRGYGSLRKPGTYDKEAF